MVKIFRLTFLSILVAARVFHIFLGPTINLVTGVLYGFAAGVAWVGTSFANQLFV